MADHKVYNRQDPDFWNPQKRQENGLDSYPDEQEEEETARQDDSPGLFSGGDEDDDDLPEPTFTELLHGSPVQSGAAAQQDSIEPRDGVDETDVASRTAELPGRKRSHAEDARGTAAGRRKTERPAREQDRTQGKSGGIRLRQRILQGTLLCLALVAVVALIIYQSRTRTFSSATYRTVADLSSQENTTYYALGSNILACSRDGASCIGTNGDQLWNITFEMQQPIVTMNHNVAAIGDYNGSVIYIVNESSVLGSVNTNLPIRGLSVSESGETAAVLNDSDVTWIYLYDADGDVIAYFKTTMRESGYPLSVAVSPNGRMVAISHLTMGTNEGNTSIAFYNFGPVGQTVTENNVAGYNYDGEIFPYLSYMNNSTLAAVSDKRLVFFTGSADKPTAGTNALFQSQVQGVFANENYIGLLFPDATGQEQYVMQIYNTSGNLVSSILFTMDYTNIQFCSDRVVINNDQAMTIYNVDGTLKYQGSFQDVVRAVIPRTASTSHLSIVTSDNKLKEMVLE